MDDIDYNKVVENIIPDNPCHYEWHCNYSQKQKERILFSVELIVNSLPEESRVLEVGSIPPIMTQLLSLHNYKIVGVDIDPIRYQKSIKNFNLNILKIDIERNSLPFANSSFDAVIFFEVFEHLRIDPIFVVDEIRRVLKVDGLLFLSTPI